MSFAKWYANFGNTILNGITSFFGFNAKDPYFRKALQNNSKVKQLAEKMYQDFDRKMQTSSPSSAPKGFASWLNSNLDRYKQEAYDIMRDAEHIDERINRAKSETTMDIDRGMDLYGQVNTNQQRATQLRNKTQKQYNNAIQLKQMADNKFQTARRHNEKR